MSVGQALKEARDFQGYTQLDFSEELFVSRSTIAMVETGQRHLPGEIVPLAVEKLDCGFLAMEAAVSYTGGAFAHKLNGDAVDLHRSSVKTKTIEELREAVDALEKVCLANNPQANGYSPEQLERSMLQVIDAIVASLHLIAVICREYSISWTGIWKKHRQKLKDKGFLK